MKISSRIFPAVDPLTPQELDRVHAGSLALLENVGVLVRCPEARAAFQAADAIVQGESVRFGRDLLAAALATVPRTFSLTGRNRARTVEIGGDGVVATPTYGATHVMDSTGVRRPAVLADVHRLHRAIQDADALQNAGSNVVEPSDVAPQFRHLHTLESLMRNTDKPFMAVTSSRDPTVSALNMAQRRAQDSVAIARLALGPDFAHAPCMIGVATTNAALVWDASSLGVIRTLALAGQAIMLAPFSIAGSNAPSDATALLIQVNAEVLAGVVYAQLVRAGTPLLYGPYATTHDAASGNSAAGTPDICLYLLAFGQLARRYGIPYRGGGLITGAKGCDYQAGVESVTLLFVSMLAGSHFLFHAGGWLEGGLTLDPAKLLLDLEELRKMSGLRKGLRLNDFDAAYAMLRARGHGSNYLDSAQAVSTHARAPGFSDYTSFDPWIAAGAPTAAHRAADLAARLWQTDASRAPLAQDRAASIRAYVAARER